MKIYVVTENIPYEGSEVKHVTTDRNECFHILNKNEWVYKCCEVWENGKKISEITYDLWKKIWVERETP